MAGPGRTRLLRDAHFVLNASVTVLLTGFEIEVPGRNVDGLHYLSTQLGVLYRF
jgi:hypothetical protein